MWGLSTVLLSLSTNEQTRSNILIESPAQTSFSSFHSWLDRIQGVERSVVVAERNGMGGLIALRTIQPNEIVARVPLSATLLSYKDDDDDNWAGDLACQLLVESQETDSLYREYLQVLPKAPPSTPCRWNSWERQELQDDSFVSEIEGNMLWRRRQWTHSGLPRSLHPQFLHFLDLVCSRTLKSRKTGHRHLVPLIDMANHSPEEIGGGHFAFVDDEVLLRAGYRGVEKGKEVTMDYGARPLQDFLLHYGFVPDRCPSDCIHIQVNGIEETVSWRSAVHRIKLQQAATHKLDLFPTTIQEDAHAIPKSENHRLALQYRTAKKALLSQISGARLYP